MYTYITLSNVVRIQNPPEHLVKYCENNFKVNNPEYITKKRIGLWTGDIPKIMYLYKYHKSKGLLQIPIGLFNEIKGLLDHNTLQYLVDLADMEKANINANIPLYDYQEKAVNEMAKAGYGILQSKAGSGKTQIGIALACKLGYRTLWLTHTKDLLKQSYSRALQYIPKEKLGKITDGKVELGEITFATVQTMCRLNLHNYKYCFNTVIVDECHRVAGTPAKSTQFSKVLTSLAARHKYGLSATLHRADGLERCMYAQLGNIAYKVPDIATSDKVMTVKVKRVDTNITYDDIDDCYDTDGTLIYSKFITALGECEKRNNVIKNIVDSLSNRQVLILSDRVGHLKHLKSMISGSELLVGSTKASERENIINRAKKGEINVVLSTFSLAKEGLDIPCLTDLIIATPVKDYAIVVQSVGRVARVLDNKPQPVVYDLVDNIPKCYKMFLQRLRHYKKSGCEICQ